MSRCVLRIYIQAYIVCAGVVCRYGYLDKKRLTEKEIFCDTIR